MISRRALLAGSAAGLLVPRRGLAMTQKSRLLLLGGRPKYLRQVATRSRMNTASNSGLQTMTRSYHFARDTIVNPRIVLANWMSGGAGESTPGNAVTYTASIEYPANTFTQVKWSGSASGAAADGATLVSDPAPVTIPDGAKFYVRVYQVGASSIVVFGGSSNETDVTNGDAMTYGATVADQTMGGTVVATDSAHMMYPVAIIAETAKPAVLIVGDSLAYSAHDTPDSSGNVGEIERSIGPSLAFINAAVGGTGASVWGVPGKMPRSTALQQYCSAVACNLGTNDVYGMSLATYQADIQNTWVMFPGKPIWQCTISPQTSSSDLWATTAGQTTKAGDSTRTQANDWIRTNPAGIVGHFETADQIETARNSGIWKANGTAKFYTDDGVHGTQNIYLAIQASGCIDPTVFARAA